MSEDYASARTLATIEHLGFKFRVVRRRYNGKPWRGYLILLHVNTPMSARDYLQGDPNVAARLWKDRLEVSFKPGSEAAMKKTINELTEQYTSEIAA